MSNPTTPFDPQPERDDAFAQTSRSGFEHVQGEHAVRLARLQRRTEAVPAPKPLRRKPRKVRRLRWLAVAAAAAIALLIGVWSVFSPNNESQRPIASNLPSEPIARVESPLEVAVQPEAAPELGPAPAPVLAEQSELPRLKAPKAPTAASAPVPASASAPAPEARSTDPLAAKQNASSRLPEVADAIDSDAQSDVEVESADAVAYDVGAPSFEETDSAAPIESVADAETSPTKTPKPDRNTARRKRSQNPAPAAMQARPMVSDDASDADGGFALRRGNTAGGTPITGTLTDFFDSPVAGATIRVEGTTLEGVFEDSRNWRLLLPKGAEVAVVTAPGFDTLYVDLTAADNFDLGLSRGSHPSVASALGRKEVSVALPPPATKFEAFDAYMVEQLGPGYRFSFVLDVSSRGRPRNVGVRGSEENAPTARELRRLLREGPDWPPRHRKKRWRYFISTSGE